MGEFVDAFVKIAGELALLGVAGYALFKKAFMVAVAATAAAIFFVEEAVKAAFS